MNIKTNSISDCWFQILYNLKDECYRQDVTRGSFENECHRLQLLWLSLQITEPLINMIPVVPVGVAPPNDMKYVTEYFIDYLLGGKVPGENEVYTYASRIGKQLEMALNILRENPGTNQASIIVGRPEDLKLSDPACLRAIDLKVVNGKIDLSSFWRSWDLYAGLSSNLGGLALLMEYIAEDLGLKVGTLRAASSGAHIYSYQVSMVEAVTGQDFSEWK